MSTIRFMRTFLAIARHGSFSEAAEHVALTQAAVSFQMRAFEKEMGRELFDRSGRLALLNRAGQALVPEVRALLDQYDALRLPKGAPGELGGSVAIGAIVSCMGGLSKVVSQLKANHPRLDVRLLSGKSHELAHQIEGGELDAAIVVQSGRLRASIRMTQLYEEPIVVVAHAHATEKSVVEVLSQHPFLRFDRSQRTGMRIEQALKRLGVSPPDFLELNAIETLVSLVRQEVGVSMLPLLHGSRWKDDPGLRILPLPKMAGVGPRQIAMIERRDHARQEITAAIREGCGRVFERRD